MKRSASFHVLSAAAVSLLLICPALAHQETTAPGHQGTQAPARHDTPAPAHGTPASASHGTKMDPDAPTATIEGAVRDLACPVQNPAGSATSFSWKCNMDCVKHGSPIIILTKDGLIYFPISRDMPDSSQNEKMMSFVGKYVRATGAVFDRKGTHAIAITQIKELKSVHITDDEKE